MAYGYRRFKRTWYKKNGVTRSQQSGRRYFRISFPVEEIATLTVAASTATVPNYSSDLLRTCPLATVTTETATIKKGMFVSSLMNNTAFRLYCTLYDSMKINGVRHDISIAKTIGSGGDIPGVRIYTMWDRQLTSEDGMPTANQMLNGPESQVVTFINNSRCKFSRSNYSADMQERSTYFDSSIAVGANVTGNDQWWNRHQMCYCPSLHICALTSDAVQSIRTIPLQIQSTYYVTFRNPKYGMSAGDSAKFSDIKGVAMDEMKESEMPEEEKNEEEAPILKKKKVVYEEEVIPDDENEEDDEESQEPMTQPFKSPMKKAGKKSS